MARLEKQRNSIENVTLNFEGETFTVNSSYHSSSKARRLRQLAQMIDHSPFTPADRHSSVAVFICGLRVRDLWLFLLAFCLSSILIYTGILVTQSDMAADFQQRINLRLIHSHNLGSEPSGNDTDKFAPPSPRTLSKSKLSLEKQHDNPTIPGAKAFNGSFGDATMEFTITPKDPKCTEPTLFSSPLRPLGIFVLSTPLESEQRRLVRRSWPRVSIDEPHAGVTFVIGLPKEETHQMWLEKEADEHKDILQIKMVEEYLNLSWKTFGLLTYAAKYCSKGSMVMKTDIDVLVFLRGLDALRKQEAKAEKLILGTVSKKGKPLRDKKSKWYISKETFSGDTYPDFAHGPGYVMTGDVPPLLVEAATHFDKYFPLEDVMMTGFAGQRANVTRRDDKRFPISGKIEKLRPCDDYLVILHYWNSKNLEKNWLDYIKVRNEKNCTLTSFVPP